MNSNQRRGSVETQTGSVVNAVLFARDHVKVAAFYRDTLGGVCTLSDIDHTVLNMGGFELVIHQIPGELATSMSTDKPPRRRERAAIKLCFSVDNVAISRSTAASLGGQVDDLPPQWASLGSSTYLGYDPEGNVFQVTQRPP
jgi:predicted enzyme related to lactoylglutathione lyase